MLKTILSEFPRDPDYPDRTFRLSWLRAALNGKLYDVLPHDFHEEKSGADEYVPLRKRRPSV